MVKRLVWGMAALALLSGSGRAIAQVSDVEQQYVEVGEGARRMPVYLDLASVRGTNFRLIQQFGNGVSVTDVAAYCQEKRLFVEYIGIYNSIEEVITEDSNRKEGAVIPGKPATEAMKIVCNGNR
ncbi:MAG: hypothetical protein N4J56_002891 [Chroococcidiopsis sp. SAG 2025]|nr:hypothetical protein [Chroococcidiopsis sp. SAG 2025]